MKLIPSLASADALNLKGAIDSIEDWPFLHLDIEDGNFVNNITFGMKVVKEVVRFCEKKEIDVHLEVLNPMEYLDDLKNAGISRVCAQIETLDDPGLFLRQCRKIGISPGFAVLPDTETAGITECLNEADYLIFMTVNAKDTFQRFSSEAFERVKSILVSDELKPEIYVDGGLRKEHLTELFNKGAAGAVLGRAVFSAGNALENLKCLKIMGD